MFNLIKQLSPNRITGKLFLISTGTLLTLAFVFYVALYLFLPSFYEQYKVAQIDEALTN
ncbi:hypothetical protein JCM19037_2907 [Geomicrobium sp. JCM 19037]|uniref:hypothetical protein n=1 Tax=Geomicrobium sp. JCM 19037 TaxID=1460634 RepID=UPI00045F102C|nr:hypothetical protein [Geomicrobium sp. JCM 19037]GAK04486.1 hypothetical protein JCM19037_2907 [Geomicrobium sp. JCM 19037]